MDRRDVHSIPFLKAFKNIRVIDAPTKIDDMMLVPWIVDGDDLDAIRKSGCEKAFGHFEFGGFMMNQHHMMEDHDGHLTASEMSEYKWVFSGHYHKRQRKTVKSGTIIDYMGNCFPHDFSDEGDRERGCMIFDNEPRYLNWDKMPTFDRVSLSELESKLPELGNRSRLKIIQDVDLSASERKNLREMLKEEYYLIDVAIEPVPITNTHEAISVTGEEVKIVDIHQMTRDFIDALVIEPGSEAFGLEKKKLLDIYAKA